MKQDDIDHAHNGITEITLQSRMKETSLLQVRRNRETMHPGKIINMVLLGKMKDKALTGMRNILIPGRMGETSEIF